MGAMQFEDLSLRSCEKYQTRSLTLPAPFKHAQHVAINWGQAASRDKCLQLAAERIALDWKSEVHFPGDALYFWYYATAAIRATDLPLALPPFTRSMAIA
jgi:hypothetical protein